MHDESTSFPAEEPRRRRALRVIENEGQGRMLPHLSEAEELLLSCMFLDPVEVLGRAELIQLTPGAFYEPKHATIYEVTRDMWRKNLPVAIDTVAEELKTRRLLDQVGGYDTLLHMSARAPTTAQAVFFLEKVFEQALLRALIREGTVAVEAAYAYTGGLDDLLGKHASALQRLADFALRRNRKPQKVVAAEARAYAQAAMAGTLDKSRVMPLGGLPNTTAAFYPVDVREEDWLILIGALRNVGKSTLARQHVAHNLVAGRSFIVFLLETSRRRWLNALAGMFAGLSPRPEELEAARTLFPEKAKLFDEWMAWIESIMEHQLWIFDDIFYLEDIERQIREINRRVRDRQLSEALARGLAPEEAEKAAYGVDGVLGDHLHLVDTRQDFRGRREQQVSHIGRRLKLLHKGLDVPGFWCAQLNRGPSNDERRPRVSDLRDSGTLEQDADCILLLHKPAENKAGQLQTGDQATNELELIQGKRRNGPAGVAVDLLHHTKLGRYDEMTNGATARPGMPKPKNGYKRDAANQP